MSDPNKRELPAIKDILTGDIEVYKKQSKLNVLLNQDPKETWLKIHPIAKTKYIPIGRIEFLLTSIFDFWNVEIKNIVLIANSVVVTVRLHYKSLVDGTTQYQDGIGAMSLQTDKGAGATDFNSIKSNAVMLAAPAAESYAIKDAAEKLGKIFGKDLNRSDKIGYNSLLDKHKDYSNLEEEEEGETETQIVGENGLLFDKKID